jgi:hypothetical protein
VKGVARRRRRTLTWGMGRRILRYEEEIFRYERGGEEEEEDTYI